MKEKEPRYCDPNTGCCVPVHSNYLQRREFIRMAALGASALSLPSLPGFAGPLNPDQDGHLIPEDKKLSAEWIKSLYERGVPEVFTSNEEQLHHIGMPVGGIACGQLYLGGDGRLWFWHIFKTEYSREKDHNQRMDSMTLGSHYRLPEKVFERETRPVEQGAAIRMRYGDKIETRTLNSAGFKDVSFRGEYPIGKVKYQDAALPVEVNLEAFSPFIPVQPEKSSLPVTIMSYTVKNTSRDSVNVEVTGWLENAVCPYSDSKSMGLRRNTLIRGGNRATIYSTTEAIPAQTDRQAKEDVVFEDFESGTYKKWTAKGDAFGAQPVEYGAEDFEERKGHYYVSSYNVKNLDGRSNDSTYSYGPITPADNYMGTLTSKKFTVTHDYISFLIGAGYHPKQTAFNLIVDGEIVRSVSGINNTPRKREHYRNDMRWQQQYLDVKDFKGKKVQIQIVDNHQGMFGSISVDHIVFTDRKPLNSQLSDQHGYGSMSWSLYQPGENSKAAVDVESAQNLDQIFSALSGMESGKSATRSMDQTQVGVLGEGFTLEPGEEKEVTFILTWFFPYLNQQEVEEGELLNLKDIKYLNKHYHNWFTSANQVADYVSEEFEDLAGNTRLWNKTYYDSTLPYWLLDRSFIPINCLATNTFLWFDNGRIWGWEGVECCQGTCQHVWQYAQGMARIFPQMERTLREVTDFGYSFREEDGGFGHRDETAGTYGLSVAEDGHSGTVMRVYREHKMSPDNRFLKQNYEKAKRSVQYLINEDKDKDGLLEGPQRNTLDAAWYGPMGWISSLYIGALVAGKEMALEVGDKDFANQCNILIEKGRKNLVERVYNGEYFIHEPDPNHPDAINSNDGCHADQVLGQSFGWQIGLSERVVPEKEAKSALQSIWKYNFAPDAFSYQKLHTPIKGARIFATQGETGTVMTTWPLSKGANKAVPGMAERPDDPTKWMGPGSYFNEVWTGVEYQIAAHMIWEGMVEKGLATARAVHDRHNPVKRNPYNEIECSDHYSRAMASYGVLLAVCGFDYHGPKGELTFAPKLTPEDFKAPFTAAEGWGIFTQKRSGGQQENMLELKSGRLRLNTLSVEIPDAIVPVSADLFINNDKVSATGKPGSNGKFLSLFESVLNQGDILRLLIKY